MHQVFGAGVSVYGTLLTSVLALMFAVPLAFGIAFYLTELAPAWLRRPVGTAIELLAAVPSIIYGMWGFFVIVPIMSQYVEPTLIDAFDGIPVLQDLFAGPPFGTGMFTAAHDPGGHGHPVHRRHHARRVRDRAAGVTRNPPTASAAPPGR